MHVVLFLRLSKSWSLTRGDWYQLTIGNSFSKLNWPSNISWCLILGRKSRCRWRHCLRELTKVITTLLECILLNKQRSRSTQHAIWCGWWAYTWLPVLKRFCENKLYTLLKIEGWIMTKCDLACTLNNIFYLKILRREMVWLDTYTLALCRCMIDSYFSHTV